MHLITTRIHLVTLEKSYDQTKYIRQLCVRNLTIMPSRGQIVKLNIDNTSKEYVVCKLIWDIGEMEVCVDMEVYDPSETASYATYLECYHGNV